MWKPQYLTALPQSVPLFPVCVSQAESSKIPAKLLQEQFHTILILKTLTSRNNTKMQINPNGIRNTHGYTS